MSLDHGLAVLGDNQSDDQAATGSRKALRYSAINQRPENLFGMVHDQ